VGLSGPHTASAHELKARLDAERDGAPFLVLRDGDGVQVIRALAEDTDRLVVGRSGECDLALTWDEGVSRVHAQLERVGPGWALVDGGLSRNGSFVNGERVHDRRRLSDGDTLRFGETAVLYRAAGRQRSTARSTAVIGGLPGPDDVSPAQRAVLRVLCRPFAEGADWAKPATNRMIADELVVTPDAVKRHLRALFAKFGVDDLPQNEKRLRLAQRALASGAVTAAELREPALRPPAGP
jgi:hypothetical protein